MERLDLIPATHRAERLFLLDLLAGREPIGPVDPQTFLEITPATLHPFVHVRLTDQPFPPAVRETFAASYRRNLMLQLRRVADLRQIGDTLQQASIDYRVLKGPVLAATVYPHPATRTMIDVDLLVRDADMQRAIDTLASIGYKIPPRFLGETFEAGDAPPLVRDEPGAAVLELHSLLDSAPDNADALDAAWRDVRQVDIGGSVTVPALGRGEFFAHVVTHVSRHHRFEGELRSLLDVALLLKSAETTLPWEELAAEWERRGIRKWIELTVTLAHLLLDAPMPDVIRNANVREEALALAAEQLWAVKDRKVPGRVMYLLTGRLAAPVHPHAHEHREPVAVPSGIDGVRARASRQWQRMKRVVDAVGRGAMRPRNVAESVELFRNRERLFDLIESERPVR